MTKSQIWVASFLVLFLILFFLGRVSKNVDTENGQSSANPMPQTNMTSEELSGEELISKLGCVNCHGANLKGTKMGPSLYALKENWSRDKLINYLRNPSSYMDSDRFKRIPTKVSWGYHAFIYQYTSKRIRESCRVFVRVIN